jgi:REP-associated tyrosine transposase
MARPHRIVVAEGIYHVTARGNRGQVIFTCRRDRLKYLDLFAAVVARYRWRCHAYCLMTNHVHLLVQTPVPNLSEGMQRLQTRYAQWFNRRYGFVGHLFQGRFHSVHVDSQLHLVELKRYIVSNPPRARLCGTAGDWEWSCFRATAGRTRVPRFLTVDLVLSLFSPDPRRARQRFVQFVAEAPARPPP